MPIKVFTGPMFAFKTTELLRCVQVELYRTAPESIVLVKHSCDARYGDTVVATHDGTKRPATFSATRLGDLALPAGTAVVCVDEGQFFEDLAPVCARWRDEGVRVYVACLDLDAERRPWDSVAPLLCLADQVVKCASVCVCKRDAVFSYKHAHREGGRIDVGHASKYTSLCLDCYLARTRADEARAAE